MFLALLGMFWKEVLGGGGGGGGGRGDVGGMSFIFSGVI